jgi:hypothetical protein
MWSLVAIASAGGSLRALLDGYQQTMAWRLDRRTHLRAGGGKAGRPRFGDYYDTGPELAAAAFHVVLGGAAGALFAVSHQIDSPWAAAVVGLSAPALLAYVGSTKVAQDVLLGDRAAPVPPARPPGKAADHAGAAAPDEGPEESACREAAALGLGSAPGHGTGLDQGSAPGEGAEAGRAGGAVAGRQVRGSGPRG